MSQSESVPTRAYSTAPLCSITPNVVMFGIRCQFTDTVLRALIASGITPNTLLIPGPPLISTPVRVQTPTRALPMLGGPPALLTVPGVAVYQVGSLRSPQTLSFLQEIRADIAVVACYPSRIPARVQQAFRFGMLNVHPSLLPQGRGPDPLFWTMRRGLTETGVTVHLLTEHLDAGPILGQERLAILHAMSEAELEQSLAYRGGVLAAQSVRNLVAGVAIPRTQDESAATYDPWPNEDDFVVQRHESAEIVGRFFYGIQQRGIPIHVDLDGQRITITGIVNRASYPTREPVGQNQRWVRFHDAWLLVEITPET